MKSKKILTYTVMFEPAGEGGYIAYVPLLPGCITQGESLEDAIKNVKDAIKGYISVLKEDGENIPRESPEHIAATVAVAVG
jgi:predicted RNase H-like HicB family nuclease